jgi:4-hydroxythreonine-4-phosphate dehydrogenase
MAAAPIALTMGEPAGVGGEISVKAWRALRREGPDFYLIGDAARFDARDIAVIGAPREATGVFSEKLPVLDIGVATKAMAGSPTTADANAVIGAIEAAVRDVIAGRAAAVVTNPIQKKNLIDAGFQFPGHTEFFEALTATTPMLAGRRRGAVMMIAGPELRTVPLTVHLPVVEAARTLSSELIVEKALIVAEALNADFGIARPRLAISGLNPHAGEGGKIGAEDRDTIEPAVAILRETYGLDVRGPLPADTMFHARARRTYDAALCMLHDQALIPAKTLAFDQAVNVTLGLPIVRTSPDHGTALDIAGAGVADPSSLIAAIRLAATMAAARAARA